MLKLYGFPSSNYYNIVKHILLLKGVDFEEELVYPGGDTSYKIKSPLKKIPCIETDDGYLAETSIIINYIETLYPENSLFPDDRFERAKTAELMRFTELYVELAARRLLPAVLMGAPVSEEAKAEVRPQMERGLQAIAQLSFFEPYLLGEQMTLADIYVRYCLVIAKMIGHQVYQWDILDEVDGLREWDAMMAEQEVSQIVDADAAEGLVAFREYLSGGK